MDRSKEPASTATPPVGLTSAEAQRRLEQYGPNEIPERRPHPALALLRKFWGPIPWMLETTVVIQILLDKSGEAAVVGALLIFNAAISFVEEGSASKALALLRGRLTTTARVLRDGHWQSVPAASLVQGDCVHLRMGDLSPADIRIDSGNVLLDQSTLTGESVPVEAGTGTLAYAAAVVRRGEATGEVAATGLRTYFGKTAELVRTAKSASHLQTTIFAIVKTLVVIDALLVGALLLYAAWTDLPFADVLPFALILLVASVPVALPATFTLATALGATELAHYGVLVARLSAIEEAAGMDVLCTDKTGTITENRLALAAASPLAPVSENELMRWAALASDPATQDPIDLAILAAAESRGLLAEPPRRLEFVPFDPAQRYSLGRYENAAGALCVVKGAPRAVAALVADTPDITAASERLAAGGNRVLAVASGNDRDSLRLAGFLALEDPPRADSASLVKGLQDLGVRVVMITGDNLATACAVAQRVGIGTRAAGADALDHLEAGRVLDHDIYARIFPEHKIKLVRLLQAAGHVVGMTGDGVNDAPALKQADVGIAVASATDVARAAAGVVLTTPGLVDALSAVQVSRRIYQRMLTYTINKIMKTLEIAVFLSIGVIVTGTFVITPLLVVLLLFANDFVTMSIATDRVSYSQTPDHWNVKTLITIGGVLAALVLLLSFTVFFVGRDFLGLPLPQLQTLVFVMLVATGQGNIYLIRERRHFWRSRPSTWLVGGSIADLAVVTAMATIGILMAPVNPLLIAELLAAVAIYLVILDQFKVLIFRSFKIR
ncbi:MAG TPA: plasma-membrane proton-efflux P-type ATPase [Xanthobacteraceae bacterium]|nr:plasma-membrane proton-efflux P-type ATPase [Xanthobacteraceae bacterium]